MPIWSYYSIAGEDVTESAIKRFSLLGINLKRCAIQLDSSEVIIMRHIYQNNYDIYEWQQFWATAGQDIESIDSGRNDIGVKLKSNFRS